MKKAKMFLGLTTFLCMLMSNTVFALDESVARSTLTDGHMNGRTFDVVPQRADDAVMGMIEALYFTNHSEMGRLYPGVVMGDILDAVKLYYINNPLKKNRPIVEVILAGCK